MPITQAFLNMLSGNLNRSLSLTFGTYAEGYCQMKISPGGGLEG